MLFPKHYVTLLWPGKGIFDSTAGHCGQILDKPIASSWMMHCCGHILWSVLVELHTEFWNFVWTQRV